MTAAALTSGVWRHAEIGTLPDVVRYWARTAPDRCAVIGSDDELTYGELARRANQVANALIAHGVVPGDHVGYLGPNSEFFWTAWFGAATAGAVLTPLNFRFAVPELATLVDDAELAVVFVHVGQAQRIDEVRSQVARELTVVVFGGTSPAEGLDVDAFLADASSNDPGVAVSPDDVALMSYTSGTTGRPKGVQITHLAFDRFFMMSALEPAESWSADDTVLMVMPNFHLAGTWLSLPALYHGGTVAVLPAFEPAAFVDALSRYRPTVMCLVPTAIELLVHSPHAADFDFGSVRRVLYAGSPIRPSTIEAALRLMDCDLMQFYGTTETYIICLLRPDQHRSTDPEVLRSCGRPFPFVDVRVVGADGAPVPAGDVGEVLVRSPTMFAGYWRQPELTAAAVVDGWYHTGDLGRFTGDGDLQLLDRLKDMVVTGGENVYPVEVEVALGAHPQVQAVAVVGLPDPTWGEAVTAFVVPVPGEAPAPEALLAHCRTLIAGYKVPKAVHLVDELPTTPSGKVQKHVLRSARVDAGGPA